MGSSSVYCNFSNITISEMDRCVLVPLVKSDSINEIENTGYHLHGLPIFGEYDDYQGIMNIEPSIATSIIEKYYKTSIEDFCDTLTSNSRNIGSSVNNVKYCWVNREVWDVMSSYKPSYRIGRFNMGNHRVLTKLGFKNIELDRTKERYNNKYSNGDKILYSDGTFLEGNIYSMSDLKKKTGIDTSFFDKKEPHDIYEIQTKEEIIKNLYYPLGIKIYLRNSNVFDTKYSDIYTKLNKFQKLYLKEIKNNEVLKGLSDVVNVLRNSYYFSEYFKPYKHYITPQCGEYEHHDYLLNEFLKINRNKINE
jgi:hypothetical protein